MASSVIRRDYAQPLNVSEVARHVNLTASQLRRAFRQEFRTSMREFRARARLEVASAEVLTSKIEVAARRVGFKRGSDFCR
jgi:AraC-like DNA-binding protein